MSETAVIIRFRGAHATGSAYRVGDHVSVGPRTYKALRDHVAGSRTAPGGGDDWQLYWEIVNSELHLRARAVEPVAAPVEAEAGSGSPLSLPLPAGANLPAVVPKASEIADDSQGGTMNVAFALDALRQALKHAPRRDWIEQQLKRLESMFRNVSIAPACPVLDEAWRRKCQVLGVDTREEAELISVMQLREQLELFRKRDRGLTWSQNEAARAAALEEIDKHLIAIDRAALHLLRNSQIDPNSDRHWPMIK